MMMLIHNDNSSHCFWRKGVKNFFAKMKAIRCFLVVVLVVFCSQENLSADTGIFRVDPLNAIGNFGVYFREGSAVLEEDYRDNASNLRHILDELEMVESANDTSRTVWPLIVAGSYSLSELSEKSDTIAEKRAQEIRKWILEHSGIKPEKLVAKKLGVDLGYLYIVLQNSQPFIGRDEALDILWNCIQCRDFENTISSLKSLYEGRTWSWLETNIFWRLQRGAVICSANISPSLPPTVIHFHHGSPILEKDFRGNRDNLNRIVSEINRLEVYGNDTVKWPLRINGYVSPEGSYEYNSRLAKGRADNTIDSLLHNSKLKPEHVVPGITRVDLGFLYRILQESDDFLGKKETLDILWEDGLYAGSPDTAIKKLQALHDGVVWDWLMSNVFWTMRASEVSVFIKSDAIADGDANPAVVVDVPARFKKQHSMSKVDTVWMTRVDTIYLESQVRDTVFSSFRAMDNVERQRLFALRSNLLLPLLNVGIEYPLSPHFSLEADWYYPWIWQQKSNKNCIELLCLTAGARWWMRKPRDDSWRERTDLTGPSIGLVAMAGYFDFERNYKGRQGEYAGVSIDFTWGTKLGRSPLRMEFTIGAGYVYVRSRKYHVETDGGLLFKDNHLEYVNNWIGPTRAAVSLVIPISRKVKTYIGQRKEAK